MKGNGIHLARNNEESNEYILTMWGRTTTSFVYLARIVRIVAQMSTTYFCHKETKWGVEPEFVRLASSLDSWLKSLPDDLLVAYPTDGSP